MKHNKSNPKDGRNYIHNYSNNTTLDAGGGTYGRNCSTKSRSRI